MKYFIRIVLIISAVLLSPLAAIADPLPEFHDGETLTAESLNKLVQRINAIEKRYVIGDTGPAGGIVFYVIEFGRHGLEAAPVDQAIPFNPGAEWGCIGTEIFDPGTPTSSIGRGAQNTAEILAGCATADIAARLADNYTLNGYTDWFLPSFQEARELYKTNVIDSEFYWSSNECSGDRGLTSNFASPSCADQQVKSTALGVRAVRYF